MYSKEAVATGMVIDHPINGKDEDQLGLSSFVNGLAQALLCDDGKKARGVVLGLEGSWGSGKSSVLNMLEEQIRKITSGEVVLIRFDPWLISGRDDLIEAFFRELFAAIAPEAERLQKNRELAAKLLDYGKTLSSSANLFLAGAGNAAGASLEAIKKFLGSNKSLSSARAEIEQALRTFDRPVVVLIDELDRIEDAEVLAIAQLVRSVLDFPSVSFLLAYDAHRVSEALGAKNTQRGQAYLEKIVQLRIPMPSITPARLRQIVAADFKAYKNKMGIRGGNQLDAILEAAVPALISTFRDVRRVQATFSALEPMVRYETDPADLLAWSIIECKDFGIGQHFRRDLHNICSTALLDGDDYLDTYIFTPERRKVTEILAEEEKSIFHQLLSKSYSRDSLNYQDCLMPILTFGTHPKHVSVRSIIENIVSGYDDFRDVAIKYWSLNYFPQFLIASQKAIRHLKYSQQQTIWKWYSDLSEWSNGFGGLEGTTRRNRWLAKGFLANFQEAWVDWPRFEVEFIECGQTVLASHIVNILLPQWEETGDPVCGKDGEGLQTLDDEIGAWAKNKISEGNFIKSIRDKIHGYVLMKVIKGNRELMESIRSELEEDASLDHLINLYFGDEPDVIQYFAIYWFDEDYMFSRINDRVSKFLSKEIPSAYHLARDSKNNPEYIAFKEQLLVNYMVNNSGDAYSKT